MLTCLWHWAVCCVHNQDRAVHLGGTGDHVLDVVSVTWAINVCVVTCVCFVLNVHSGDRDTTGFFFWRAINLVVRLKITEVLRDRRCQCRLAVVNVANCADVNVRFIAFKLFLSHDRGALSFGGYY